MSEPVKCASCNCEIINVGEATGHWRVQVTDPLDYRYVPMAFCLGCMIKLAQLGVNFHRREYTRE